MDKDHHWPDKERETHPILELVKILDAFASADIDVLQQLDKSLERVYRTLEDMPAPERYPTLMETLHELHGYIVDRIRELDH